MKIILSGLTIAGAVAMLSGALVSPAAALPVIQPRTTQSVSYYHHRYWHHRRHHPYHHGGGLTIHL